jgi:hypothetical protein
VDFITHTYTTRIRPFVDSDYEEEIRWYFVDEPPPGTVWIDGGTRFGSGEYHNADHPWPGPGEVQGAPRPFTPDVRPYRPLVPGIAGPLRYFQEGAPWSARGTLPRADSGMPLQCAAGMFGFLVGGFGLFISNIAGFLVGGRGHFDPPGPPPVVGDGGVELDGSSPWSTNAIDVGDGGVELDGSSPFIIA